MTHTPGPWAPAGRNGGWDGVNSADGTEICALEYNNSDNARLIAAAPDLLAAVKALYSTHKPGKGQCCNAADMAIDAIQKAEGLS